MANDTISPAPNQSCVASNMMATPTEARVKIATALNHVRQNDVGVFPAIPYTVAYINL